MVAASMAAACLEPQQRAAESLADGRESDTIWDTDASTDDGGVVGAASCKAILDAGDARGDGLYVIDPGGNNPLPVYCDMTSDGGGWTLVYNRPNPFFSPDHMHSEKPPAGPDFAAFSTHWFVLPDSTRWRWQVAIGGLEPRQLITSIPEQAKRSVHATVQDQLVEVYDNTTGAELVNGSHLYYQTITYDAKCLWGCGSGGASWWGLVNVEQGAGDAPNPGIGGHTDRCFIRGEANDGDAYTWPDEDLELYLTNWKNIGGQGGEGGTYCNAKEPLPQFHYRFWVR